MATNELEAILSAAYVTEVMGRKPSPSAEDQFKAAMSDSAFSTAAQAKLEYLNAIPDKRCFVSKTNADFLRRMLSA